MLLKMATLSSSAERHCGPKSTNKKMEVANAPTESDGTQKSSEECLTPDWLENEFEFCGSVHTITQSQAGPINDRAPDVMQVGASGFVFGQGA